MVARNSFRERFACRRAKGRRTSVSDPRLRFAGDKRAWGRDPGVMLALVEAVIGAFVAAFRPRASLVAENLALRQQLATLTRDGARHRLGPIDRAFWVVLSRIWSRWADVLAIVKPATVINVASSWIRPVLGAQVSATRSAATFGGGRRVDRAHDA